MLLGTHLLKQSTTVWAGCK